ncbi:MAG: CopG family transcriptional regulator [Nitrospirae bacterium]|nr:CopG family transcriptional regulator [Nitrospirota bacterium]
MSSIVATNIRISEEVLKSLKYRAIEERKSVNQLIREAIEGFIAVDIQPERHVKDSFENVIGIAKSGIKNGSTKHDYYLYGKKK